MKVSVIIPTYNRSHFISFAIDSVLRQDFADLEVIVVDDGSTDDTKTMLEARYPNNIQYIYQKNQGFGSARNRGVTAAAGEYIAFLDSDDIWKPEKIKLQFAIMEAFPDISFLFTDFTIFKESGEEIHNGLNTWFDEPLDWKEILPYKRTFQPQEDSTGDHRTTYDLYCGNLYHSLLFDPYVLPSTAIVRKKTIPEGVEHSEGDPFTADWNFFALLSQHKRQACFLPLQTTLNRSHDDPVRATRTVALMEKLRYRLRSVETIWKSDPSFMHRFGDDVAQVEADILLKLAKQCYRMHRNNDVRNYLRQWKQIKTNRGKTMALFLSTLVKIPGSNLLLKLLR